MHTKPQLLKAVHDVVHDYANLVSSGTMAVAGSHLNTPLTPPINTHVGDAFLVNCRKFNDFFKPPSEKKKRRPDDIIAEHFLPHISPPIQFDLPTWAPWDEAMNKQLLHITFSRVTTPKAWEGHDENKLFLAEFKKAWKTFLSNLEEPYKSRFNEEIAEKLKFMFSGLDLY